MLVALIAAALVAASGAAAAPTVPGAPAIPSVPGSETARFKVVVEGTATAAKDEDWSALIPCTVLINARIEETTTYRRGKGVVMEFVRLGKGPRAPVIVRRAGRRLDASLALTTTTTRKASGSASRQNPPEGGVCDPRTEDLTKGPDCGKPFVDTVKAGLLYDRPRGLLSLETKGLGALLPELDCPHSEIRGGIPSLRFAWPSQPKLPQFSIPPRVIFGKKRVIVRTEESGQRKEGPTSGTVGGLSFTVSDFGSNRATIRLIRVK